ncbi:hypothetical protein AN958_00270 [Leucoagaricus sp. SymC.cos]|nr:hypothetical protein AN958_00270 [Leucoagaricus sp. SymC.cos]
MDSVRGNACSADAHRLKSEGHRCIKHIIPGGEVNPPIDGSGNKEQQRGWRHPQLAALLIPAKHAARYAQDPDRTVAAVLDGSLAVPDNMFPAFLYPEGEYNPKKVQKGLFRGPFWIYMFKMIFTGPTSADSFTYSPTQTKHCQAVRHGLHSVTPATIAYACTHTYFAISSWKEWRSDTGSFSKERFFCMLFQVLDKPSKWRNDLFGWANELIFGHRDGRPAGIAAPISDGPNDFSLFMEQVDAESDIEEEQDHGDGLGGDELENPSPATSRAPTPASPLGATGRVRKSPDIEEPSAGNEDDLAGNPNKRRRSD